MDLKDLTDWIYDYGAVLTVVATAIDTQFHSPVSAELVAIVGGVITIAGKMHSNATDRPASTPA